MTQDRGEARLPRIVYEAPARLGLSRLWRRVSRSAVAVLLLHGVLPDADSSPFNSSGKFISPEKLRTFLERISRLHRIVPADQAVQSLASGRSLASAMVVTFDDGYANNYEHALPVLGSMGLPFTVFVTTGLVGTDTVLWNDRLEFAVSSTVRQTIPAGMVPAELAIATPHEKREATARLKHVLKARPTSEAAAAVGDLCEYLGADPRSRKLDDVRFMTADEIRRMAAAGVTLGAHGVTHAILSREKPDRVRAEVVESRQSLETLGGRPVDLFAYPNGRPEDFNAGVKRELASAGYKASFTSVYGLSRPGGDLLEIPRIPLDNRWSYMEFETRASGVLEVLRR
jgi:peptidoglycan/xylan/chitin deacetylase (PgdA/CDA1 family)